MLVVGGNDCGKRNGQRADPERIIADYKLLLKGAKAIGHQVKESSILPRTVQDGRVWEITEEVNMHLEELT